MTIPTMEKTVREVRVVVTAAAAMTRMMEGKKALIVRSASRRLTSLD
jgi:hypothetical protein